MPRTLYTEEHEDFRAAAREFVERSLKPRVEEMISLKSIPRDIWLEAGKQGFFGLDIPEEFGGAGAEDYRFNAVLAEEWAHFNAATAACFGIHADVCPPYIVDLGTQEQKERWLPGMASGELICAIGMTEPSGGSDLAALKTTAVRADDGSGDWILNGSKTFITNGYQCDLVIVAARTDASKGPKGITLFMVERSMAGFVNGRKLDKVGQDESDTAELFFENVRVPDANRLGAEGLGFIAMMQRLPQERIGAACSNIAHAKQIFVETLAYAKERKAFGQPIGDFQAIQFKLADMATQIEAARQLIHHAASLKDAGQPCLTQAAMAKLFASEMAERVCSDAIQIHGGYGYVSDFPVERIYRDVRVCQIYEGTSDIQKILIGRGLASGTYDS